MMLIVQKNGANLNSLQCTLSLLIYKYHFFLWNTNVADEKQLIILLGPGTTETGLI